MDVKLLFGIAAVIALLMGYIPYLRDIFLLKTKPHAYTWLIWAITQSIAVAALLHGGGGAVASLNLFAGAILVSVIFLLSLRFGTKNITGSDTIALFVALAAIGVWLKLDNPFLAVVMVSAIDGIGYFPTYRKTWSEPWSETLRTWILFTLSAVFAIFALAEYNALTVTYLATVLTANVILIIILSAARRRKIRSP